MEEDFIRYCNDCNHYSSLIRDAGTSTESKIDLET